MLDTLQNFAATAVQSEFFAGGLALGLIGVVVGLGRLFWGRGIGFIARRLVVTTVIDNQVSEFRYLLNWLEEADAFRKVRRFRLTWTGGRGARKAMFAPAIGRHWFMLEGQLVILDRELSEKAKIGRQGTPMETLTLTLPFGNRARVESWIAKGAEIEARTARIGPSLHIHVDGYWSHAGDVVRRSITTLIAEDDRVDRLLDDVRWFYGAKEWYAERGVPWRRGYLLHGPPGTGKSSVIRAIASEMELGLAILDIGRKTLSDDQLAEAMADAPRDAVLVFEDVDAAFAGRDADEAQGISFSGLLNAIDGVAAQEGRAIFMTTNHIERLDPALIRPGRADSHVELGHVCAAPARQLFLRFFPGEERLADQFVANLGDGTFAPAALQGWLLANASDVQKAAQATGLTPLLDVAAE